jgi:hypothetical protein
VGAQGDLCLICDLVAPQQYTPPQPLGSTLESQRILGPKGYRFPSDARM